MEQMKACHIHMIFITTITKLSLSSSFTRSPITHVRKHSQQLHAHQHTQKVCILSPQNLEHKNISSGISRDLGIPVLTPDVKGVSMMEEECTLYHNFIHIIPYQFKSIETYAVAIQPTRDGNSKQERNGKKKKTPRMQPFCIDFCPPRNSKMGKRIEKQGQQKGGESLLKAAALHKIVDQSNNGTIVYDLNAGFGQDSTLLAIGGATKVQMVERDPIVGLLLSDAMRRLRLISDLEYDGYDDQYNNIIARAKKLNERLSLHVGDSIEFSKKIRKLMSDTGNNGHEIKRPDICYLDPMFPPRSKSSAVKKNMQVLHGLFQHDNDQDDIKFKDERNLLEEALALAKRRVVVKRPINALPLGVQKDIQTEVRMPSYELKGSINRFDIYIIPQPHNQS